MADPALEIEDPRTPAEAKRHWMIDRLWYTQMFTLVLLLFLVFIIWLGRWPQSLSAQRLAWLGWVAAGSLISQGAVSVYFALGGPVGRWRARWGNKSFGADDDETAAREAYDSGGAP